MATKRAEARARYFTREVACKKGWNLDHPEKGGDFLEEQEIVSYFPMIGLGQERPDFLLCIGGEPSVVIETKNDFRKYQKAIDEAVAYGDKINLSGKYCVRFAIGVAGDDEKGYIVCAKFLKNGVWKTLKSRDYEVTAILSKKECLTALQADNYTLEVEIPSSSAFIDAAIELSNVLRKAKVEPVLRPKVVGAITTAVYKGDIDITAEDTLREINTLSATAIQESPNLDKNKKQKLIEAITLTGSDYERLNPYILRIISILKQLNVKVVLQSDADFLGMFYEAFLRYGYDNNAMGIVFTPRHITRLCTELIGVEIGHRVVDITCGTGGFLVSAFDALKRKCSSSASYDIIRDSIFGFDTNPTVWALSCLNMFFRGDGKSHIENVSSLSEEVKKKVRMKFNRAFLNPPFHQEGESERDFIDASMDSLMEGGLFAGVVYAGVFADEENAVWRAKFLKSHTLLAMISLPDDLFYPAASAPTSIIIAKAHVPQDKEAKVFMAKVWNDGYEKLKGKRIECAGGQIEEVKQRFFAFLGGAEFCEDYCMTMKAGLLFGGEEFSPQQWIPSKELTSAELKMYDKEILKSMFVAITNFPEITGSIDEASISRLEVKGERFPLGVRKPLSFFFDIKTGKSSGEKNYGMGICPYVSSGDGVNGIIRLVHSVDDEICEGCISVSAFGTAYLQPWNFMARGNGGSSVRVLIPKFRMTLRELFWFISQINSQKWRFPYARMAIKSRLLRLEIDSPKEYMEKPLDLIVKLHCLKKQLEELSDF